MADTELFRILIVDDVHPVLLQRLGALPQLALDYQPDIAPEAIATVLPAYQGLVIRTKIQITGTILAACTDLRFIARAGAGLDNIDEGAAQQLGIKLYNAPEGNRQAVAEHVAGMLLTVFNKLREADAAVRSGRWERELHRGIELMGKTVGIIGYGNNGAATARVLQGIGCEVLAYDKYKRGFGSEGVKEVPLEALFERADILSLHVPLTKESRGMVNASFLGAFQKPLVLVNAARGEIVQLEAVVAALEAGQLTGACLDVLENEKPQQWDQNLMQQLFAHPRVLLSPHVAGWTVESYRKISEVLADKLVNEFFEVRS
jgi:D-3-phosphoglycerate dehydrogenase